MPTTHERVTDWLRLAFICDWHLVEVGVTFIEWALRVGDLAGKVGSDFLWWLPSAHDDDNDYEYSVWVAPKRIGFIDELLTRTCVRARARRSPFENPAIIPRVALRHLRHYRHMYFIIKLRATNGCEHCTRRFRAINPCRWIGEDTYTILARVLIEPNKTPWHRVDWMGEKSTNRGYSA